MSEVLTGLSKQLAELKAYKEQYGDLKCNDFWYYDMHGVFPANMGDCWELDIAEQAIWSLSATNLCVHKPWPYFFFTLLAMVFSVCGCESTLLDTNRAGLDRHGRLIGWHALAYIFFLVMDSDYTGFGSDWSDWKDVCLYAMLHYLRDSFPFLYFWKGVKRPWHWSVRWRDDDRHKPLKISKIGVDYLYISYLACSRVMNIYTYLQRHTWALSPPITFLPLGWPSKICVDLAWSIYIYILL